MSSTGRRGEHATEPLARRVVAALPRSLPDALPAALARVLEAPSWPGTLERPAEPSRLGTGYDTSWSRHPVARHARVVLVDTITVPLTRLVARPEVIGRERLENLDGPCLFVANHSSHADTPILLAALPVRFRHHCVIAAASDTFFDRRWKAALWSFSLAMVPMERMRVNRASADLAAELLAEGWSVIIYPEGGRSPDGWGQEFRGGAAYLAKRTGVPVVPVHLHGVRPVLPKGGGRLRPGVVTVRFGRALRPALEGGDDGDSAAAARDARLPRRGEDARRFAARIELAVAELADEAETDWWSARRRAAASKTPSLQGPEASPWRRSWELPDSRQPKPRRPRAGRPDEEKAWSERGR